MVSLQQWTAWLNKGSASIPHILLENYKQLGLHDGEIILIIHLHSFLSQGIVFPSLEQLQARLTCTSTELTEMLTRLHKEGFIYIESSYDEQGKVYEAFTLEPLWEKLTRYLACNTDKEVASTRGNQLAWPEKEDDPEEVKKLEADIFRHFEIEFGRPLSPLECETISLWLDEDKYEVHLIFLALREAVISNKLSLRYIDRILLDWHKSGLKNMEEVRQHSKKFRQNQISRQSRKVQENKAISFSFYNWLE